MATLGSTSSSARVLWAVAMAISANWEASGLGTTAQSAKIRDSPPAGATRQKHQKEAGDQGTTVLQPDAPQGRPDRSAVVWLAPATEPSASPQLTMAFPK